MRFSSSRFLSCLLGSLFLTFVCGLPVFAQSSFSPLSTMQSTPDLKWYSISNSSVQLIYPEALESESIYIANLIEHYSHFVGQTFGISQPHSFTLLIRPEEALPNGFVTLAPRRSEWFASSTYTPVVGGAEWYQMLAVHEYRHVNQMDFYNDQSKFLYAVMGEFGEELAIMLGLPSWYLEGDAVWSETKYTESGRGRLPHFLARLKALVLSDQMPTYDQLLNGSYQNSFPNHYVFGYALVSYAVQKFGEDVWTRIVAEISRFPHPFRFYSSFAQITGQRFDDFFNETFQVLKKRWQSEIQSADQIRQNKMFSSESKSKEYKEELLPAQKEDTLYYIKTTLDGYPSVMAKKGEKEWKISELFFINDYSHIDFGFNKAVYNEFRPDVRFSLRRTSDLMLLDLKDGSTRQITLGKKLYFPSFNPTETKLIATEFRSEPTQSWNISEFDLEGHSLQSFSLDHNKVAEVRYLDDQTVVTIMSSPVGLKTMVLVDLFSHQVIKTIVPPSRNGIHSLFIDNQKNILFAAQFKGKDEIFLIQGEKIAQCTHTLIGADDPYLHQNKIYYSEIASQGAQISQEELSSCQPISLDSLVDFHYLSDSPSDNFNQFPLIHFPEQESLYSIHAEKYIKEPYGDFDKRLFIPHTWGFLLGRGGQLGAVTDNYLGTLGLNLELGTDPEEKTRWVRLGFDIKKYYPLIRISTEQRNRSVAIEAIADQLQWNELSLGLQTYVPFNKRIHLNNFSALLTLSSIYTYADDFFLTYNHWKFNYFSEFLKTMSALNLSWFKDPTLRSLQEPWLVSHQIAYENADQLKSDGVASSYRISQQMNVQTPGIGKLDGLKFSYSFERQNRYFLSYKFLPDRSSPSKYVFSRGYPYESVYEYNKYSINYLFPVAYPDLNIPGWLFLRRIYINTFYDSTLLDRSWTHRELNSYGLEGFFENQIVRLMPLNVGLRLLHRLLDDQTVFEVFLSTNVSY